MVNTKHSTTTAPKKKRSPGGLKKKAPTAFNKYMSDELARLKAENVEGDTHKDRWALACKSWHTSKEKAASEQSASEKATSSAVGSSP